MKKIISMLLSFVLVANIVFVSTYAEDGVSIDVNEEMAQVYIEESDNKEINLMSVAEDFEWELSDDGTLTISGNGDMPTDIPWADSKDSIKSVIINEGITSVANSAFSKCSNLENVTIPEGVISIGSSVFFYCTAISQIELPNSLVSIGNNAFYQCEALEEVVIPENVTSLGSSAFAYCDALTSVSLPDGLGEIKSQAFGYCENLTEINLPKDLTSIGNYVFDHCSNLVEISISDSVTTIGNYAFQSCVALESVTLSENLISIGELAFYGCAKLQEITLPDSVTTMGAQAFSWCKNLENATLSANLELVPSSAFNECTGLTNITIPEGVKTIDNNAFAHCSGLSTINLPDTVTTIGDYTFWNCSSLQDIKFSSTLKEVGASCFVECTALTKAILPDTVEKIGEKAFYKCNNVEEIYLGKSLVSIGAGAFYGCSTKELFVPKTLISLTKLTEINSYQQSGIWYRTYASSLSGCHISTMILEAGTKAIPSYILDNCVIDDLIIPESVVEIKAYGFKGANVKNMTAIPDTITDIGEYAFAESCFLTLEIPETITEIPAYAFEDSDLQSISLHNGVTTIGSRAFSGTNLESITIPDNVSEYGYGIFSNCENLTSVTLPENMDVIPDGCFSYCTSLGEITLPEGITEIGSSAFSSTAIANIDIPDSVTKIGDYCFRHCDMLEELILPPKLSCLGGGFIDGCEKIKEITVPKSVTSVTDYHMFFQSAFGGSVVEKIIFEDGIKKIPDYICAQTESLKEVILPQSVTEIGMDAFSYCDSLETVTIYDGCTKIEAYAFVNCNNLKIVEIPESVTEIGYWAFNGCPNLMICCYPGSCAEEYAIDNNIPYESIAEKTSISLTIKTESGDVVEEGYTVSWYNKESGEFIASGNILYGIEYGKEYIFDISFEEDLAYIYKKFERKTVIPTEENNIFEAILIPYDEITVSGTVIDADGSPIANAEIRLEQAFGSEYAKTETATTDENGYFSKTVKRVPTKVVISANGYYSRTKNVISDESDKNEISLGTTTLIKLPENKIVLSMNKITAAKSGDESVVIPIFSADNLSFTIFNKTKNKEIDDFVVQYPNIILGEGEADSEDVIEILATDNNCQMTTSVVEAVLDSQKMGFAAIDFIENGKFVVNSIIGNESTVVMIFDKDGRLVKSEASNTAYTSELLQEGSYSAVFIKKTDLLRSVPNISKLNEFGLLEDVDYITEDIIIEDGLIKEIDSVTVPQLDESKLYYTVSENTKFISNNATVAVGRYITMKCEYEIDDKYISSNETITIELPGNTLLAEGSLTLDGKISPYSLSGNIITVNTNKSKGVIRFYVVATDKGKYALNAYLSFTNSDNRVTQPIGTALFTAEASKLLVPEETSQKRISVTGTTLPRSNVTLYDNGIEVGTTTSNANGSWSVNFELIKTYSYSYHNIYAKIENDRFGNKTITTDTELLIYDKGHIELSKITMINTGDNGQNISVFDFITPGKTPSYRFWPGKYPKFTFKVEFTGGDNSVLSDVYVVTTNRSGDKTYVKCNYDKVTGLWIGTHNYNSSNDAPVSVNAVCSVDEDEQIVLDKEFLNAKSAFLSPDSEQFYENLENYFDIEKTSSQIYESGKKVEFKLTPVGEYTDLMYITFEEKLVEDFVETENMEDFIEFTTEDNLHYYYKGIFDSRCVEKLLYCKETSMLTSRKYVYEPRIMLMSLRRSAVGYYFLPDVFADALVRSVNEQYDRIMENLEKNKDCIPEDIANGIRNCATMYRDIILNELDFNAFDAIGDEIADEILDEVAGGNVSGVVGGVVSGGTSIGIGGALAGLNIQENRSENRNKTMCPDDDDDKDDDDDDDNNQGQPVNPILDPSGYVYEAVPSNRVEGVKAEAYYYDYPIDEFGMPGEVKEEILWNAEDYDQENPLYTDKGGMYAWDVPMGEWLVKFTKDGYYDTDSKNDAAANDNGYLPVPPPQTEVNTAIVSKSAPTVESVNVYNDEVQIIFSQYMQIGTVNTSNVKITSGGKSVSGTISPSNAEYDYNGENEYASIFTFVPDENVLGTATVEISGVKNYNGKTIAQKFAQSMSVEVKPESISIAESVNVVYNSGALVEISILPKEAGINKTIIVSSSSPSIADVVNSTVTTDENGKANIMLNGNLPGEAEIKISIDGTDLEATTRAIVGDVVDTSNSCAKVSANIASGTTVEKGTKVTLTTETEGAEIYYTLDGTCPCVEESESRIKYTGPIEINDDTFIIAYAVKSDMESSSTSGFTYKVQKEVQKTAKPVANPVGGQVSSGTEITLSTTTKNATIHYTTDGTTPTKQSTVYTAPIKVTAATTIKAIAVKEGMTDSDVMEEKYTIKSSGGGGGTGGGSGGSSGGSGGFSGGTITPSTPVSTAKIPFKDVKENDWYYEAVKFVYEKGITSGVSETEYAPNNKVTRGQFITMLCRAYGIKEMTGDNFADCGNTWYTGYLAAAKQLGISNGVGNNKFAPEKEISREEMVTLIYNYLKSVGKVDEEITETTFADNDAISDWAKSGVAFVSSKGYVKGKGNNIFDPKGDATRAELAQIFFNMFK